jgi:hypothetical protein
MDSSNNITSGVCQLAVPTRTSHLTNDSGFITSAGTGLSKSGTTLNHSNSVTAQTTQAVYPIKIDAQGHISAYGSAVTIPTVNNATLTIQKNGTTVNSFTANASSNVTANITVPTKVSDLTNDSGFITSYTDEKLKTPVIGEDVGYRYFVLTATSDSAETKIRSTGDLRYSLDEDSTLEIGSAYVPSKLVLHSGKGYSANTTIVSNELISSATITLPSVSGTVALTSNIPTKTSDLTNDSGFINSIKTINNQSLIGSGNITVSTTAAQIIRWTESA